MCQINKSERQTHIGLTLIYLLTQAADFLQPNELAEVEFIIINNGESNSVAEHIAFQLITVGGGIDIQSVNVFQIW